MTSTARSRWWPTTTARIVGHVQMSRAWIGDEPVLSLGPIGVLPARQGQGIGSSFVRAALQASRERGETAVILLGSQVFYPRFGFRPGSTLGLRNPYAGMQEAEFVVQEDDFMIAAAGRGRSHVQRARSGGTPRSVTRLKGTLTRASLDAHADVAQLVEHHLAKVGVAGSNPVVRSRWEGVLAPSFVVPGDSQVNE